jgi:hypothetical protein
MSKKNVVYLKCSNLKKLLPWNAKKMELGQFFMVVQFITEGQNYPWVDPLGTTLPKS